MEWLMLGGLALLWMVQPLVIARWAHRQGRDAMRWCAAAWVIGPVLTSLMLLIFDALTAEERRERVRIVDFEGART